MKRKTRFKIVVYILITGIVLFLLFPFFVAVSTAFKDLDEVYPKAGFMLTERVLKKLEKNVPEDVYAKLEELKEQGYQTSEEFVIVLEETIGKNQTDQYKAMILNYASDHPHWIPYRLAWENFQHIWERYPLAQYFINSIIIASGATVLTTILCVPAAYAFARLRFSGRKSLLFMLLVVQMFSPIIVVISLFKVMGAFHLLDTLSSLIIVNAVFTLAFAIWMMNGYFSTIPKEIEEAALIDGCSRLQTMTRITLPIAMPGVATVIIYTFITAWNEFMFALTFINSMEKRPLTLGLYNFIGRWTVSWHYLMAAAILAIIPVVFLFMLIEKQLVQGLAGGAIKG